MILKEEISRIKKIMNLSEGLFDDFNISDFKKMDPPSNDSEETKKELEYLKSIDIDKRFVQEKDDITGNFFKFLDDKNVKYDKELIKNIKSDAVDVIQSLKKHFKRQRPFKFDDEFKDPNMKSTRGYCIPFRTFYPI
jgi:hypothetical protein